MFRVGDWMISSLPSKPDNTWIDIKEGRTYAKASYPELAAAKPNWVSGNNIVIPDITDKHIRVAGKHGAVDTLLGDCIRNITGYVTWMYDCGSGNTTNFSGAMYMNKNNPNNQKIVTTSFTPSTGTISFNASRVVPTGDENRPVGWMVNIYLKAKSGDATITALTNRITALETANNQKTTQINTINSKITTLETANNQKTTQINTINDSINTINGNITTIDGRLDGIDTFNANIIDKVYPVGSLYYTTVDPNDTESGYVSDPNILFNYGTWELYAKGKTIIGVDKDDTDFHTTGMEGGEKSHILSVEEMPRHAHNLSLPKYQDIKASRNQAIAGYDIENSSLTAGRTLSVGENQPHNNLQPFVVVAIWKRIA